MGKDENVHTAYKNYAPEAQEQKLPGGDVDMEPLAEHASLLSSLAMTKVERWHRGEPRLEEYVGSGKLKGKKAIITGGDSGIGRTVAAFFAREGCDVTIGYLKEEEKDAQETKKLVEAAGQKCLLVPGDLVFQETRDQLVAAHLKEYQYLDILVNNASQQIQCPDIADIDMDNVEHTFKANIIQYIGLTKAAIPHLKRGDVIINTTSVTAYKGSAGMLDYSASKGAMATFTRSLATQVFGKGIRVCGVAPGPVYTPLQPASRPAEQMEDWSVGSSSVLNGRVGQPAELGESYVYLATSELSTGTIVHPNSGQYFIP
ncbi:putative oxidoreductase [Rhodotorula diobovata]|uniref:Putative oxidoreductase n=1 Tax=Rhodotorula diobovata TaxID=5288 RepID=A0A5C5G1C1_9BASI|nr:putative oxidoreductase [Rhodotorula diobovata]